MKAILALVVCAAVMATASLTAEQNQSLFTKWVAQHGKSYETNEFFTRYNTFLSNMALIEAHNAGNSSWTMGMNQFGDLTAAEFKALYTSGLRAFQAPFLNSHLSMPPTGNHVESRDNFDWNTKGAVTPVKNQEQCGSCWAFSTIGNVEGIWFLSGQKLIGLAEQQLVDCSNTQDQGCNGGWPFWALTDMLANPYNGYMDTEASYPYTAEDGTCAWKQANSGALIKSYKSWCTEQTADCTEDQMVQLLLQYGPLSACLDATPMQYYTSGIDNPSSCDPDAIDHCITITGYGEQGGVKFWHIKNSWGTDWGETGYYRLIRGTGACGINKVITIASTK